MEAVATQQHTPAATGTDVIEPVDYRTEPSRYKHWKLDVAGEVATLTLNIDEDGGIRPGYKLKLNSYDLGVDIELHDALQRIRFEHPTVKSVVFTSGKPKIFCSGANIYMLGVSTHAWKVNFCKFTNETRNGIEDASQYSGLKFIAACNGTTAGGGYELALACDEIILVDDRNSSVSLPEVPLLGVLPGTGGLTRVTDKRKVRRDHADIFCTISEGVRGQRAKDWRLVDDVVKAQQFGEHIAQRAAELAKGSIRPAQAKGVALPTLERTVDAQGYHYEFVDAAIDADGRTVTLTVRAPSAVTANTAAEIEAQGANWWPLKMARELDDAILNLRTNHLDVGLWQLRTEGDAQVVMDIDATIVANQDNWFVRETLGMLRRTLARIDVSSRSLYALIEPGSCFAGTLLEIALAADRSYMLDTTDAPNAIGLTAMNFGPLPMVNGLSRIAARFYEEEAPIAALKAREGSKLNAAEAFELGLVTAIPDDLDWADEVRIAVEERVALSPDALTGLEANLRFGITETMNTRIFGRLSAWQNWIFIRPNAVGSNGALKLFGSGKKAQFDWNRV
ncbi:2,3-epoxybenzoyl-CoA dihydrolase [Parazoarcus communis]|uniref:2,3-epoxybenzoyl-CoA dihydrolase n=1 Tax=Parazoarcus communis TaxID=41977 RepID=UPI001B7CE74C|nr:2,3-epoxybenzoyl-CoA dihydrolase [Parazoarcus communis]